MIGKTVKQYEILEKIGVGAMSVVYKARDQKLDRFVVLKFLPTHFGKDDEEKNRFTREAKIGSILDHENICTIYEINETEEDQMFIAMPYYNGETLKDKINREALTEKESVNIFTQMIRGLSIAHKNNIIHRDLKPANIIITENNVVKILDFGIAKLTSESGFTKPGTIMGTAAYMSPEQAKGESVDNRTDIWSAGIILYEMLAGKPAYEENNEAAIMYSIIVEDPEPIADICPDISQTLQSVIEKSLAKNPGDRYQKIDDMLEDIEDQITVVQKIDKTRVVKDQNSKPHSFAVLPLRDMSPGKDQEYFCDGLTDEIINKLIRIEGIKIVARTSVFQFKSKDLDIREIGRKLRVETILEGSIQKAGNKIKILIQLINVTDGFVLWSEEYRREMNDIFEIQDEISQTIVKTLKIKLANGEQTKIVKRFTENIEAYKYYLKGRFHWNKRIRKDLIKSIDFYKQAIEADPDYALAYSGLADTYSILGIYGTYPMNKVMPKAKEAVKKALSIDNNLSEAHISLGCVLAVYDWKWEKSYQEFQAGINLNPRYATAHHWYAINYLVPLGKFDDALSEIDIALNLDPISLILNTTIGLINYYAAHYDIAIEYLQKALEMEPNFAIANYFLGQVYVQKSMFKNAIDQFQKALKLFGGSTNMLSNFGHAVAKAGNINEAEKILNKIFTLAKERYVSAYDIATIYYGLGDKEQTFHWLNVAVEEHSYLLIYSKVDPVFKSLSSDPRYISIQEKVFRNIS